MSLISEFKFIKLTKEEIALAARVGCERNIESIGKKGYRGGPDAKQKVSWGHNVDGAMGELAVAKWLGIPWSESVNTFREEPDVGPYEVRTVNQDNHRLPLNPRDDASKPYVLVFSSAMPVLRITGWIWGHEGMVKRWKRTLSPNRPDP